VPTPGSRPRRRPSRRRRSPSMGGNGEAKHGDDAGTDCTGVRTPVGSPMPTHCTARIRSANGGARGRCSRCSPRPRRRCARDRSTMPIGSATSAATRPDTTVSWTCWPSRCGNRLVAVPLVVVREEVEDVAEEPHHAAAFRSRRRPARAHGVASRCASTRRRSATTAKRQRQHDAHT